MEDERKEQEEEKEKEKERESPQRQTHTVENDCVTRREREGVGKEEGSERKRGAGREAENLPACSLTRKLKTQTLNPSCTTTRGV